MGGKGTSRRCFQFALFVRHSHSHTIGSLPSPYSGHGADVPGGSGTTLESSHQSKGKRKFIGLDSKPMGCFLDFAGKTLCFFSSASSEFRSLDAEGSATASRGIPIR